MQQDQSKRKGRIALFLVSRLNVDLVVRPSFGMKNVVVRAFAFIKTRSRDDNLAASSLAANPSYKKLQTSRLCHSFHVLNHNRGVEVL